MQKLTTSKRTLITLLVLILSILAFSLPSVLAQSWTTRAALASDRGQASVVLAPDGFVYVIGGFADGSAFNTVEVYYPASDNWDPRASLPTATRGAAATVGLDGKIYVFGGYDATWVSATQIYDPATNTWTTGTNVPTAVWAAGTATAPNGLIYVIGGQYTGGSGSTLNQIYDPSTDSWSTGASMPTPRQEHAVVLGPDGLIYAMGGLSSSTDPALSSVEAYNPATDTWSSKASMPAGRVWMGVSTGLTTTYVMGGGDGTNYLQVNEEASGLDPSKIYIFGGGTEYVNNAPPVYADTYVYDPISDGWSTGVAMPTARREQGAATMPFSPHWQTTDVEVPLLENPVTLDGAIIGDEWVDAIKLDVAIYFNDPLRTVRFGNLYLKHDCVNLWVCMNVSDPNEDVQSWMAVFYDVLDDGYFPGSGDDEKAMMHPNEAWDLAIIPVGPGYDNDTDIGGTLDIQGATGYASGALTYEFVHPLNSGDTIGNDPALQPGDSIQADFMIGDPGIGMEYYGYLISTFNLTMIPCPAVGGEILPINTLQSLAPYLLILVIAAGTVGVLYKKRTP